MVGLLLKNSIFTILQSIAGTDAFKLKLLDDPNDIVIYQEQGGSCFPTPEPLWMEMVLHL